MKLERTTNSDRWTTSVTLSLALGLMSAAHFVAADSSARTEVTKIPFATIGPTEVKGPGGRYPPFYYHAIVPSAVVRNDIVYCSFQDTGGRPIVMAHDVAANDWSEPVYASQQGLGRDAHGNPSICIDQRGYLHVFYGCHRGPLLHARSSQPNNISNWVELSPPTDRATYPQTISMTDGTIFLLYRAGGHTAPWCVRTSQDFGDTWSAAEKVIEMRLDPPDPYAAAYATICPGIDGKSVHVFWVHKDDNMQRANQGIEHPWRSLALPGLHEAVYRYNMYYAKRSATGIWHTASGDAAKLPISKAFADSFCLVHDSRDELTNIGAGYISADGRPFTRFVQGRGDWKKALEGDRTWNTLYAMLDNGQWRVTSEVPADWPTDTRTLALTKGTAAFGEHGVKPWFMSYDVERNGSTATSILFLYHPEHGYAGRGGGPVKLP